MTGKPKVVGLRLVGCGYKNGFRMPGWGIARLDNGTELFVPEAKAVGFNGILDAVEDRADTREYRKGMDHWVKTGTMPFVGA